MISRYCFVFAIYWGIVSGSLSAQEDTSSYLQISGVYPHLATHNQPPDADNVPTSVRASQGEAGIGAVVPWAGRLWYLSYPQHKTQGSFDKLYEVDANMNRVIRPESVGGTHAARMIHKESNQLIIGPYFIDAEGRVRVCDLKKLTGRMTAVMRHLEFPETMVYFYDMEGMIYEVDVNTLDVTKLFNKPFPGWHGKGAYTAQNRVVFANNGERDGVSGYENLLVGGPSQKDEEAGVLVEWDGKVSFRIIERKKFTDVTGAGGIHGSPDNSSPLWAIGWDKNSVLLKLLDGGKWSTFRLSKASHAFDHRHGWYTEWPRIRQYLPERLMMIQHASMWEFPNTFSAGHTSGIRPLATHLRYIPDVAYWREKIILAADEAAMMENPMCGQAQSNLWFGTSEELKRFGPSAGWGGVWRNDTVKAGVPSDPFLFAGYRQRVLHLKHNAAEPVRFVIEVDKNGNGMWQKVHEFAVNHYAWWIVPKAMTGEWVRVTAEKDVTATAFFHYLTPRESSSEETRLFDSLMSVQQRDSAENHAVEGVIRPAARNQSLQWQITSVAGQPDETYCEIEISPQNPKELQFLGRQETGASDAEVSFVSKICRIDNSSVTVLPYAVMVTRKDGRQFLLPRGNDAFDIPTRDNEIRTLREVQSERWLANIHGTFYEIPRWSDNISPDFEKLRPAASHDKGIVDFCSWRGLLVFCGTVQNALQDGHFFRDAQGRGLWFGQIDDLWKLGKPKGTGFLCDPKQTIQADTPSLPFLMTNYDRKTLTIHHNASTDITFRLECDVEHSGEFVTAFEYTVPAGETFRTVLPDGFLAHWVRVVTNQDCKATVMMEYQ